MKTYLQNGTMVDRPLGTFTDEFCIQELLSAVPDRFTYSGDQIINDIDSELVSLYDTIQDRLFPDRSQYDNEVPLLPVFIQSAGQSLDFSMCASEFRTTINSTEFLSLPNAYQHLYLVDCQFLVGSIQNNFSAMIDYFVSYFTNIVKADFTNHGFSAGTYVYYGSTG